MKSGSGLWRDSKIIEVADLIKGAIYLNVLCRLRSQYLLYKHQKMKKRATF